MEIDKKYILFSLSIKLLINSKYMYYHDYNFNIIDNAVFRLH